MGRAEDYGCSRDHSEVAEGSVTVVMVSEEVTRLFSFISLPLHSRRISSVATLTHTKASSGSSVQVYVGQDIILEVEFQNLGDLEKVVNALLSGSVIYYTGVIANDFKEEAFSVIIPGKKSERGVDLYCP